MSLPDSYKKDDSSEGESKLLAEFLKSTHKELRSDIHKCKDENEIYTMWIKHTMKKDLLHKYSETMYSLATEHWDKRNNVSRINWVYNAVREYYFGELLTKKLDKERRRVLNVKPDELEPFENGCRKVKDRMKSLSRLEVLDVGSCYNPFGKFTDFRVLPIDLHPAKQDVYSCDLLSVKIKNVEDDRSESLWSSLSRRGDKREGDGTAALQESKKKRTETNTSDSSCRKVMESNAEEESCVDCRIADVDFVGCKNSDLAENNFPGGNGSVSQRNEVKVFESRLNSANLEEVSVISDGQHPEYDIKELPGQSFDVVIFCFLLEYIPTAGLRHECCRRAYELLRFNGLLCLVTPDSKHVTGNSHIFKMWKITLAFMGFERVKYEKCAHFHGMVFRKVLIPSSLTDDAERELREMQSREFFNKYSKLDWDSLRSSLYLVQEMQAIKER